MSGATNVGGTLFFRADDGVLPEAHRHEAREVAHDAAAERGDSLAQLKALAEQTLTPQAFELVVLANACTDGTLELLQNAWPPFRLGVLTSETKLSA